MGIWTKRTKIMSLRLEPKQWEAAQVAATNAGYRTPSEWVRNLVNLNLPTLFENPATPAPKTKPPFTPGKKRRTSSSSKRPRRSAGRSRAAKKPAKR